MPKQSIQQFAASYKQQYPQFADTPDEQLVSRLVRDYPDLKDQIAISHAPTFADSLVTGGLRVGGPIIGGLAGSLLLPGGGTYAGGAAGGAAGEGLAELYEKEQGIRQDFNPAQMLTQMALGAVPIPGTAGAGILKNALIRGGQGAVLGGVATTATNLAENGQLPSLGQVAQGAGGGALMGGVLGGFAARPEAPPGSPAMFDRLESMRQDRIRQQLPPTFLDHMVEGVNALKTRYVDQFNPIRNWVNERIGTAKAQGRTINLAPIQNPGEVIDVYHGGKIKGEQQILAKRFGDIMDEAGKDGLDQRLTEYLDLKGMLHGEQTLRERATKWMADPDPAVQAQGHDLLDKLSKGELFPKKYTGPTMFVDLQTLSSHPQFQRIEQLGQQVFNLNRNALRRMLRDQIISPAVYKQLRDRGMDYVPLPRLMDDIEQILTKSGALDLKQQQVLFNLHGSARTTENPLTASLDRGMEVIAEAGRNKMGRTVANLRHIDPVFTADIQPLPAGHTPAKGYGTISVYEHGTKVQYQVPKAVADAMSMAGNSGDMPMQAIFRATRSVAQLMMTAANPAFNLSNIPRDIQDQRILNPFNVRTFGYDKGTGFQFNPIKGPQDLGRFVKEWGQNWYKVLLQDPDYERFLRAGGSYSGLQKNITPEHFLNPTPKTLLAKVLHPFEQLSNASEEATKLSSFKRALAAGKSDFEAALETRRTGGSPDFGRRGTQGALANQLVMFFNAQVQGTARNIRTFATDPMKLAALVASASIGESALFSWNNQFVDPDGTRSLDRVSGQDRQNNWIIMTPSTYTTSDGVTRHNYVKVPKGHINRLIHNPLDEALEEARATFLGIPREGKGEQVGLDVLSSVVPGSFNLKTGKVAETARNGMIASLNPAMKIPLEWLTNLDSYRGIPIEPKRLEGVSVENRATPTTSPTMKGISKMLVDLGINASPMKLQHAAASITPGLGEMALGAADLAAGSKANQIPLEGNEKYSRMPVAGPILRRIAGSPLDQQEADRMENFYNLLEKTDKAAKDLRLLQQRSPQEMQEFIQDPENRMMVGLNPILVKFSQQLAKLRSVKDQMASNPPADYASRLKQLGDMERGLMGQIQNIIDQRVPELRAALGKPSLPPAR